MEDIYLSASIINLNVNGFNKTINRGWQDGSKTTQLYHLKDTYFKHENIK